MPAQFAVDTYSDLDDHFGSGGGASSSGWTLWRRTDGPRGPLLTLITRVLWRIGLFCVLSGLLFLPLSVLGTLQAERLTLPYISDHEGKLLVRAMEVVAGGGLALMIVGAKPGWLVIPGFFVTFAGLEEINSGPSPAEGYAALAIIAAVMAAFFAVDTRVRRRGMDPDKVRIGLGEAGSRRVGIGLLLLAALWVAAIRIGLPYRLAWRIGVNPAVWAAVVFGWFGLLGVTWHALPRFKTRRERDADAMAAHIKWLQRRNEEAVARMGPPPKLAHPSAVEPAHLADLVLPESVLADLRALIRLITNPNAGQSLGLKEPPTGAILY